MVNLLVSRKYLAATCVLAIAAAVSLAARTYSGGLSTHLLPTAVSDVTDVAPSAVSTSGAERKELSVLRLTLSPEGFTPAQVTLPHSRFLLVVYNKSGLEEVGLSLDAEGGGRLHESRAKGRGSRWREVFDPPPGEYVLGVADHPEWACHITVTPH
jgi:hypothetical protein